MNFVIGTTMNKSIYGVAFGLILFMAVGFADEDHHEVSPVHTQAEKLIQTECPVTIGNKIDPNVYTDYKGKQIYFCCNSCKSAFEKNPEKYLHRLPQFASADISGHNHGLHEHGNGLLFLSGLIVPMGITTLSLVASTVFLGAFRRLKPSLMLKWHKRLGFISLVSGAVHAILVLVAH